MMAAQFAVKDRVLHTNEHGARREGVIVSAGTDAAVVRFNGKARETAFVSTRDLVSAGPSRHTRHRKGTFYCGLIAESSSIFLSIFPHMMFMRIVPLDDETRLVLQVWLAAVREHAMLPTGLHKATWPVGLVARAIGDTGSHILFCGADLVDCLLRPCCIRNLRR